MTCDVAYEVPRLVMSFVPKSFILAGFSSTDRSDGKMVPLNRPGSFMWVSFRWQSDKRTKPIRPLSD
ncbi:unnamed protein product [Caenorhabditis bovis]|uniref:Uncharacterized protein n=1 Tax=Caenorhabditis bovis TaxID=2654633 RepID=A0A8S1EYW0_9PELO|nr:unnamed protein product [Caenorhabditis bovis]